MSGLKAWVASARLQRRVLFFICCVGSASGLSLPVMALDGSGPNRADGVMVVRHDPGGSVDRRMHEVAQLRRAGVRIEIRGDCWSACTMYLALPDTCVSRTATLGFHGPSSPIYGVGLSPEAFEHWSRIMADHYPQPLRQWYLQQGRMRTTGFYRFRGADLIRMGVPRCST